MNVMTIAQISLLSLIIIVLILGLYAVTANLKQINQQQRKLNQSLEDIARSQRILANNPKDFEETKRINQLKRH